MENASDFIEFSGDFLGIAAGENRLQILYIEMGRDVIILRWESA